jgi:hypothetical protein
VPAAACATSDDASGVQAAAGLQMSGGDANGVGSITATCTGAIDNVGNVAPDVSVHYTVVAYVFGGFAPPLEGGSAVKSGSTVPIKFQIRDWNGALVSSTSVISSIQLAGCGEAGGGQDAAASGGTALRFDPSDSQFVFNWKTAGLAAGCYSLAVNTVDTLRHAATVIIR